MSSLEEPAAENLHGGVCEGQGRVAPLPTRTPTVAICPHAEPVHPYTTKPVLLCALSTHENAMDDDEIATALSPLGAAGSVVSS